MLSTVCAASDTHCTWTGDDANDVKDLRIGINESAPVLCAGAKSISVSGMFQIQTRSGIEPNFGSLKQNALRSSTFASNLCCSVDWL